jgi:hypothetical protein
VSYPYRLTLSYAPRATRLERVRLADAAYDQLRSTWASCEAVWERNPHGADQRRDACLTVLAPLSEFILRIDASQFACERLNDVLVAFDELHSGRRSTLLSPAPVHPGTMSMTDLMQQAVAQVCVDLLRQAGFPAGDARKRTADLFEKHQLPKFSQAKLRSVGSRLTGRGCTLDPAYDLYEWASRHAVGVRNELGIGELRRTQALRLADKLIELAKKRDHRRDFFFAHREDSSELP